MHEYLVSYNFKMKSTSPFDASGGVGNIIITAKEPITSSDLPAIVKEIERSPGMGNTKIVLLSFSKFGQ